MRYLLVDGNHLTGRCRATTNELTTSWGHRSGVVYGFLKGLSYTKNVTHVPLENTLVCWDGGRSKVRMELYPEYKAQRHDQKEDLSEAEQQELKEYWGQLKAVREALGFLGCPQVRVDGVEADDLLAIFARWYEGRGHQVIVHSGDQDMHQLVSDSISIFDPKKELRDKANILAGWGVARPDQIALFKALTGDGSDNISGVKGIGDARALIVIKYWDAVEAGGAVPGSIPEKEEKWVKLAWQNKAIIERNLKLMRLPKSFEDSQLTPEQAESALTQVIGAGKQHSMTEFIKLLQKWELKSILDNLQRW